MLGHRPPPSRPLKPVIAPEVAFATAKFPTLDLSTLPDIDPDDLVKNLAAVLDVDSKSLAKHIATKNSYRHKKELFEQIALVYWRLSGKLDAQLGPLSPNHRVAYIERCKEGLKNCTEGFHDRINSIINSFNKPVDIAQLLHLVRNDLVASVAATLTDEVHATNYITKLAAAQGFGVDVNSKYDPYSGAVNDRAIIEALQKAFSETFEAFNLPFLLSNKLEELCIELGYSGKKPPNQTYPYSIYDNIQKQITTFLPNISFYDLFTFDDDANVTDINWPQIQKELFTTLLEQGYAKSSKKNLGSFSEYLLASFFDPTLLEHIPAHIKSGMDNFSLCMEYENLIQRYPALKGNLNLEPFIDLDNFLTATHPKYKSNTILTFAIQKSPAFLAEILKMSTQKKELAQNIFREITSGENNNCLNTAACSHHSDKCYLTIRPLRL